MSDYVVERLTVGIVEKQQVAAVRMPRARFLELVREQLAVVEEDDGQDVAVRLRDRLMPVAETMPAFPLRSWIAPGRGCGCLVGEYLIASCEVDRASLAARGRVDARGVAALLSEDWIVANWVTAVVFEDGAS